MKRKAKHKEEGIKIADADEIEQFAPASGDTKDAAGPTAPTESAETAERANKEHGDLARELAETREKLLRARADHQNALKRCDNQIAEATRYANASLIQALLGTIDDFERTLGQQVGPEASAVLEGVKLIYDNFTKVLTDHRVEVIEALGKPFDPRLHSALMQQPDADHPPGTVIQEVQRGYRLGDRVLRPAKVIVAAAPTEGPDTPTAEQAAGTETGEAGRKDQ